MKAGRNYAGEGKVMQGRFRQRQTALANPANRSIIAPFLVPFTLYVGLFDELAAILLPTTLAE
jgi:hypothetical protein